MIDYTLARKLKESGFPQKERGQIYLYVKADIRFRISDHWKLIYTKNTNPNGLPNTDWVYVPTLEELIAACGEGFSALWYENDVPRWCACTTGDDFISEEEQGATPEIAVANLYLALHPSE